MVNSPRPGARWEFWIDRGGTFTDVVARDPEGHRRTAKLLSVSAAYDDAAVEAMRRLMQVGRDAPFPAAKVASIKLGTTVATNALLERKGAKTLFVTTRGFADVLVIGDQARPDLFALEIAKPSPLYAGVLEADERLDASGKALRALDEAALLPALRTARGEGFESLAVAFLHADLNPAHEQAAAALARTAGFSFVSLSSEVSPLPKFVPRAQTTVVDAYLTPVLAAYVSRLEAAVEGAPLYFMTSAGALVAARAFRGRDALISGPAGGAVGVAAIAAEGGGKPLLGFDMGGTSTDVSRFAGELARRDAAVVAGVKLRSPMLDVETVAAGGGSMLAFDGLRARVGPTSAGADPGPACYGRGGPATVTDANLVLGRLDAARFPSVFGPAGDQPLDAAAARSRLAELAEAMGAASPEAAAEGFLAVAVEQMAGAIRRISSERGFDPRDHALVAFGGAAGQVACQVAEALGVEEILSPSYASVLSAFGIGQARMRALRTGGLGAPLDRPGLLAARALADRLAEDAKSDLKAQGATAGTADPRLYLAYDEADAVLAVPLAGLEEARRGFEASHRRLFGFIEPDRRILIASVEVEAVEADAADDPSGRSAATGARLEGPALITRPDTQIWVAAGWSAAESADGLVRLVQSGVTERRRDADLSAPDPVTLELYNRRFMGIAEAMGAALERTAHSVNIKERLDFSCALFDAEGGLVANAPHMPVHLGSMGASVRAVRAHHPTLARDQAFALNSPYAGGTHLPDITVVMPVFVIEETPAFFVAARGHHADIGGVQPGSMPPLSRRIEEEGVVLDALPIMQDGVFLERDVMDVLASGRWPARAPKRNIADLKAQIAACQAGAAAVAGLIRQHGAAEVARYMGFVQQNAEAAVRRAIGVLGAGEARAPMDGGGEIVVRVGVDRERRESVLDFSGSSAQLPSNFNAPASVVDAAALYVFRCLVDDDIPLNAGCLAPLKIVVPEGSMLNPGPPAAVVAGNVETSQHIVDALFAALGVMANAQGTMNNFTFGDEARQYYETLCGGAGATASAPGASAVHTHMTNSRLTDPEILERRYPVRLEVFEVRRGSGGRGARPGGDGVRRRITFLAPMEAALLSTRRTFAPQGLAGGEPALAGAQRLIEASGAVKVLPGCFSVSVRSGDAIEIETPGGGGHGLAGPPSRRDL
jgi:5-oxoprolinase (ATP-hydrolysing)